jgi:hypothetical protein
MHSMGFTEKPQSYKSYKAEKFNKLTEKGRGLRNAIQETSLKPEDKEKLAKEIIKILEL